MHFFIFFNQVIWPSVLGRVLKLVGLLGWLINNKHIFLTILETRKSKRKELANSRSGRIHVLVHRQLSFLCVLTWQKVQGALWGLFYMGTNPAHGSWIPGGGGAGNDTLLVYKNFFLNNFTFQYFFGESSFQVRHLILLLKYFSECRRHSN